MTKLNTSVIKMLKNIFVIKADLKLMENEATDFDVLRAIAAWSRTIISHAREARVIKEPPSLPA